MPELCRFYGVRIKMYYDDHNPPHFHAEYAGDEALITIDTLDVMAGELPSRALGAVRRYPSILNVPNQEAYDELPEQDRLNMRAYPPLR